MAATQVLETMLYEVRPSDVATYSVIAVVLLAVALAAGYLRARRASCVDPSAALPEQ